MRGMTHMRSSLCYIMYNELQHSSTALVPFSCHSILITLGLGHLFKELVLDLVLWRKMKNAIVCSVTKNTTIALFDLTMHVKNIIRTDESLQMNFICEKYKLIRRTFGKCDVEVCCLFCNKKVWKTWGHLSSGHPHKKCEVCHHTSTFVNRGVSQNCSYVVVHFLAYVAQAALLGPLKFENQICKS